MAHLPPNTASRLAVCASVLLATAMIMPSAFAACPPGNSDPNCPNSTQAQQQRAAQQAAQRAQQEQQRAQQQAAQRAQQEQQRAAQQRAQQEQQKAAQQAAQRAQQEQQRASQQAAQRQQQEQRSQQRAQEAAKQANQQAEQRRSQQQAEQRAQQQEQQKSQQRAQQAAQQANQQAEQRRAQQQAEQRNKQQDQQRSQQRAQDAAQRAAQQAEAQRGRQQGQQQGQQQAKQEEQRKAQQQAQQRDQQRAQQEEQRKSQQQAQQRGQQEEQRKSQQQAQQREQQRAQQEQERKAQQQAQQNQRGQGSRQGQPAPVAQPIPSQSGQAAQQGKTPAAPVQQVMPSAPAGRPVAPAPGAGNINGNRRDHTTQINPSTTVRTNAPSGKDARGNNGEVAIRRNNPDGSQLVVSQRPQSANRPQNLVAYRQTQDAKPGVTHRTYLDGRRVTVTPDAVSRSVGRGPTFVTRNNGLREATLRNGKPMYREALVVDRGRQVMQRTVYARYAVAGPVYYRAPLVRVYDVVPYYGAPIYVYRPVVYEPVFFVPFWSPFVRPVMVVAGCVVCPSPVVSFAAPVTAYADPIDLMGDLQISEPINEGMQYESYQTASAPQDDPELMDLRMQVSDLQQQVAGSQEVNQDLRDQLAQQSKVLASASAPQKTAPAPVAIPEDIRQQMRKQVRLTMAQQQNQKPLLLSDVVGSGYARVYLFQVAEPMEVVDAQTGESCMLNSGALLRFAQVPRDASTASAMKVTLSRAGDCPSQAVVTVGNGELQEMLNGFSQRVSDNLKRVHDQAI